MKFIGTLFLGLIIYTLYLLPNTFAQSCTPSTSSPTLCIQSGLLSAPTPKPNFYLPPTQTVIDPKAAFVPYKIPSFDDLKSLYFDQSKSPAKNAAAISSLPGSFSTDGIYATTGDLTVSSTPAGTGTEIIFVAGNLNITANYTYGGTANSGTVFVVKGDANIAQSVTQINAVIISSGTICSAYDITNSVCPANDVTTSQLIINGSLISLNDAKPIKFKRALTNNASAAEVISQQPKYLVILRNLISQTLQKWSEVTQ